MKLIFIILFAASFIIQVSAQSTQFTVTTGYKSYIVSAGDDNTNTLLEIDSKTAGDNSLTISANDKAAEKDWKRSFIIYDSSDNPLKDFIQMQDGNYCIKISWLKTRLNPNEEYFIYTTAIPKDPQKAMLIKVARILLFKVKTR